MLEGFAAPAEHPLNSYRRGFYQVTAQVGSKPSGETVVRLTTKVTAWYADPAAAHSGYQLLVSNGRVEADLFDQLTDQLSDRPQLPPRKLRKGRAQRLQPRWLRSRHLQCRQLQLSPRLPQRRRFPRQCRDSRTRAGRCLPRLCLRVLPPTYTPDRKHRLLLWGQLYCFAGRSKKPRRRSQESGASQKSSRCKEIWHRGCLLAQPYREDSVPSQRPR